jgi:phage shock protein PspC (stress-responsive transcriptional regulator)
MASDKKRLYRSRNERMLAGVCGGIGEYFDIDPTVIRILFVLFALVIGGGILLYIILLIIMPLEPDSSMGAVEVVEQESEESE